MTNNKRRSNNHQSSSSHHFGGALSSAALIIIASHALTTSPSTTYCSSIIRPAAAFSGTASPSSFIVHSSHHPPQRQSIIQLFSTVDDGSRQQYGQYGTDEEIIIPSSSSSPQKRRRRRIMRSGKTKSSLAVVTSVKSTAAAVSSGDDQSSNINIGDASQGTLSAANNSTTTTTPSSKKQSSTSQSSISSKIVSGAPYQRAEMMEHTILTKDEEFIYGRQVVRARELRERIEEFLEEKRLHHDDDEMCMMEEEESRLREEEDEFLLMMGSRDDDDENLEDYLNDREGGKTKRKTNKSNKKNNSELNEDFLSYELEYLSVYGFRPSIQDFENNDLEGGEGAVVAAAGKNIMSSSSSSSSGGGGGGSSGGAGTTTTLGGFDLEDDLLIDHAQHRSHHMSQLRNNPSPLPSSSSSSSSSSSTKRTGYRNSSSSSTAASNSYTPLLHIPLHELSDHDVISTLDISGGRTELVNILLEGAYAREVLMRRNVKLVTSIAKQWMRNSFSTANANLGSSSTSSTTNNSGRSTRKYLSQMYEGSWDRPSLDEAVQEGMLGLARAVDKYDPERGLRFSTYATHWITSYVRVCFQRAVTGCLRVPSQLHDIKAAYQKIVKDHLVSGEEPPEQTAIAKTLGITPQRLSTAIRATGSLVSVDAPVISPGSGSYKGSAAGGDGGNSQELLILDTLKCAEPKPEDQVEISFLRQCLENAMASELTPCERDVLRLRLGLDSGTGKTVREIVEICGGGVTMSDVRSAERRAFKKLRSPTSVHTHNLLAYLDLAGADITFR